MDLRWSCLDEDRQRAAKRYARSRYLLFLLELALGTAYLVLLLLPGLSRGLKEELSRVSFNEPLWAALFFAILYLAYSVLSIPLAAYGGYLLPKRYGLSTQTWRGWFLDWAKSLAIALVIGAPATMVVYYLLGTTSLWWLYGAGFVLLLTVVFSNLAPILLIPLFYKLKPLTDEELAKRIIALAQQAGASIRAIDAINLSSKTTAANAALVGLGNTRRVLLGDTLIQNYTPEEIGVIFAHELGHHVHWDIPKGIVVQTTVILLSFWIADKLLRWNVGIFGFDSIADVAAMPLLAIILEGVGLLAMPLLNVFSRSIESSADRYALSLTRDYSSFISAMEKLADQNLSEADPPRWAEWFFYTHPPISQRVKLAQTLASQQL